MERPLASQIQSTEIGADRTKQQVAKEMPRLRGGCRFGLVAAMMLACLAYAGKSRQELVATGGDQAAPALWLNGRELPAEPSQELKLILNRIGPNMRASTNYHDYPDIGLDKSIEAWQLLHHQAQRIAQDQIQLHQSHLGKFLRDANVSEACQQAANYTLTSMSYLDSWAIEMWSATGNFPPVGIIDGHVTDVGSYKGCIDISIPANRHFNHSSYCVVPFRPIVPSRPHFHSVFSQLHPSLVDQFNESDFIHKLASKAQYFYYLYRKTAFCVPYACTPGDIQRAAAVVARRMALMSGPVKCFTRAQDELELSILEPYLRHEREEINQSTGIENEPILVQLEKPLNHKQLVAAIIVGSFFAAVFVSTAWHVLELFRIRMRQNLENNEFEENYIKKQGEKMSNGRFDDGLNAANGDSIIEISTPDPKRRRQSILVSQSTGLKYVAFHYLSMVSNGLDFVSTSMRSNEIKCLHGFRVLTMFWIICVHTMQYNEWSGFTRVYETETSLKNPLLQPMINANYVVDNFFLMSGLLACYTTWSAHKGSLSNFRIWTSLLGRYLRLTPQALLVSLLYILLPLVGDGPFWYDMVHDASKNCEKNWWVNMLHLQAFYRDSEMCNLVGWWISVDMFYYIVALVVLYLLLGGKLKSAMACSFLFVIYCIGATAYRHYVHGLTPNNLGNVPQIGEVWSEYVVKFNWSPYPHAYVFFLGLWIGYALANNKCMHLVRRWSHIGWPVSIFSLLVINVSSHVWVSGALEPSNQLVSTSYNIGCAIVWASSFGWIIMALHYGSCPTISKLLSGDMSIMLSKASFIIYLSHMLLVRMAFGMQYNTLEVSGGLLVYLMAGNIFVSVIFGVFLCIAFEGPCLKFQRWILAQIKPNKPRLACGSAANAGEEMTKNSNMLKNPINTGPAAVVLLK